MLFVKKTPGRGGRAGQGCPQRKQTEGEEAARKQDDEKETARNQSEEAETARKQTDKSEAGRKQAQEDEEQKEGTGGTHSAKCDKGHVLEYTVPLDRLG